MSGQEVQQVELQEFVTLKEIEAGVDSVPGDSLKPEAASASKGKKGKQKYGFSVYLFNGSVLCLVLAN